MNADFLIRTKLLFSFLLGSVLLTVFNATASAQTPITPTPTEDLPFGPNTATLGIAGTCAIGVLLVIGFLVIMAWGKQTRKKKKPKNEEAEHLLP